MSALAEPTPFTFDLDLGRSRRSPRVLDEAALAKLLAEARDTGRAEGETAAASRAAEALSDAARAIAGNAARQAEALEARSGEIRAEAARLALAIATKLAGELLAREPSAAIEALIAECLGSLDAVPHLVIRCEAQLADAVRDIAERHAAESGFAGRLVILGEPGYAPGDCRIEWADGGVARDATAIAADIEARVARFIQSRNRTPRAPSAPGEDQ